MRTYRPKHSIINPNMANTALYSPVTSCYDPVTLNGNPVINHCYDLSQEVLHDVISQEITQNRAKNTENHPPQHRIASVTAITCFVLSLCLTAMGGDKHLVASFYGTTLSIFIGFNLMGIAGRWLSLESRLIISVLIPIVIVATYVKSSSLWKSVLVLSFVGSAFIILQNGRLLREQTFSMSPEVQQTIINNPDTLASERWIFKGMDDCRTFALRNNHNFDDEILNGVFRSYWMIGFLDGYEKTEQCHVSIEKAQKEAKEQKARADQLERDLNKLEKAHKVLQEERKKYDDNLQSAIFTRDYQAKKAADTTKQNEELQRTNEELLQALLSSDRDVKEALQVEEQTKEEKEERAKELLRGKKSIRDTVKLSGVPFRRVCELRKEVFPEQYQNNGDKIKHIEEITA